MWGWRPLHFVCHRRVVARVVIYPHGASDDAVSCPAGCHPLRDRE